MKLALRLAVCLLLSLVVGSAYSAYRRVGAGEELSTSGAAFLASLDETQLKKAVMDYDSPARVDWHFIPKAERKGLQIREMTQPQRTAAHKLLKTALSKIGYEKTTRIMATENLLKELEKTKTGTPLRDAERYYFTLFGTPAADTRWGLSIEGHHMSLSFVIDKGEVISSSPLALAANPATLMGDYLEGFKKGDQILAGEEAVAMQLLASLTDDQKKVVVVSAECPAEVRNAGKPQPMVTENVGLAAADMTADQQEILRKLIGVYTATVADEIAAHRWKEIEAAGFDKIYFSWAGAQKLGEGHYYLVQGPTFQIEFVNIQPDAAGNPANHIHCVWRDVRGDFALPIAAK